MREDSKMADEKDEIGRDTTVSDIVTMVLDDGCEMDLRFVPLTDEERAKGPDVLAMEFLKTIRTGIMEARMQTMNKILDALGDWMRLSHLSKIGTTTSDELSRLAFACENVARVFLESAANLREVAYEKQTAEYFQERQRRSDGGVTMPVGYVKQDKKEIGFKGSVEVWKHPSGREIRIRLTDGKEKKTSSRRGSSKINKGEKAAFKKAARLTKRSNGKKTRS